VNGGFAGAAEAGAPFALDPRLDADSHWIADGPLSQLRLIDEARYDWLVLVPRVAGASEWLDLDEAAEVLLLHEVQAVGGLLRAHVPCEKLNVGALGNIVRQLHVHVLARNAGDAAWPGPVWGASPLLRRTEAARVALVERWRLRLAGMGPGVRFAQ
jgi:diadenosine tetraphosphate (Ap4A) HIT family hydrolase